MKLDNHNDNDNKTSANQSRCQIRDNKQSVRVYTKSLQLGSQQQGSQKVKGASITCSDPMILLQGTCARKLAGQHIDVLQPEKIKTIADVSVVCFDKTGTLTGSVVSLFLMHGPSNREAQSTSFSDSSLLSTLRGALRYMTAAMFSHHVMYSHHQM